MAGTQQGGDKTWQEGAGADRQLREDTRRRGGEEPARGADPAIEREKAHDERRRKGGR